MISEARKEITTFIFIIVTAMFATGQALGLWYVDRAATSLDHINARLTASERTQVELVETLKWMRNEIVDNKNEIKELSNEQHEIMRKWEKR